MKISENNSHSLPTLIDFFFYKRKITAFLIIPPHKRTYHLPRFLVSYRFQFLTVKMASTEAKNFNSIFRIVKKNAIYYKSVGFTKSLCEYVSNQVQYNMESAQYLK